MQKNHTIHQMIVIYFSMFFIGAAGNLLSNTKQEKNITKAHSHKQVYFYGHRIHSDVVFVKRKGVPYKTVSNGLAWESCLQKAGVKSLQSAFPHVKHRDTPEGRALAQIYKVYLEPGQTVREALQILSKDPLVEYAEPWYLREVYYDPNDPAIIQQWYIDKIQTRDAWDISQGDTSIVIGIVDTGVNWEHPDLLDNIWVNLGEIPDNGVDDDGNDYIDDVHGWDFGGITRGQPDNDPRDFNYYYHGTEVAGVASAVTDNGVGIAAPAFKAKIMAVKAFSDDDVDPLTRKPFVTYGEDGIQYAVDNGAHIINCSWGGPAAERERDVINYARSQGVLVVAAAGNSLTPTDEPQYPAALDGVFSVANSSEDDYKNWTSFYGYWVDCIAPGTNIYTTSDFTGYAFTGGTSFSAPLASSVAALIKSQHPDWTGEQLGEQIRVTADPISDPLYTEGKLGGGRINAYRALTESHPSIRLTEYTFQEGANSNHDEIFDPGEEIWLTFTVKNYLASVTGVMLQFQTNHTDLSFSNYTFTPGTMDMMVTFSNEGNPTKINIAANATRGEKIDIFLNVTADDAYTSQEHIQLTVSPSYSNISAGNVELTLTSSGQLGFADYSDNTAGVGFLFGANDNLLFEGAFMAGVSADSISDVARGVDTGTQNQDFSEAIGGELVLDTNNAFADEYASTAFTDMGIQNTLNLHVNMQAHAFYDPPNDDFILLTYIISNQGQNTLKNIYAGLFADWDVGANGNNSGYNKPGYDAIHHLGYIYDTLSDTCAGIQILNNYAEKNYYSIHNDEIYSSGDGYTDDEKWQHLSSGIQPIVETSLYDYSHVLSVGPFSLSPSDSAVIGFAMLGGANLADLLANAQAAQIQWDVLFPNHTLVQDTPQKPYSFQLYANWPNPFNAVTTIGYDIPRQGHVTLTLYDLTGREVEQLVNQDQESGHYEIQWNSENAQVAASGVYLVRLTTGSFQKVQKMILLK